MRLADNGRACHPIARPSSLRHWTFGDTSAATVDRVRGVSASIVGAGGAVPSVPTPTGNGRRFRGALLGGMAEAAADAESTAAMLGAWTMGAMVRVNSPPGGTFPIAGCIGTVGDAPADPQNYLALMALTPTLAPAMLWEHGAGVDVLTTVTGYTLKLYQWTYVVWRKSVVTGIGPGGTCTLECFINGVKVFTQTLVPNASNGTAAIWRMGHELSGGVPANIPNLDLAGVYVWTEPLADELIQRDARRFLLSDFFSRIDIGVQVADVSGVMRDMHDVGGIDMVDSVETTDEIDQACVTARVQLAREVANVSLATLKTDTKANLTDPLNPLSYAPLIDTGRRVEVISARVPLGIRALSGEMQSVFSGTIDNVSEGSNESVVLDCRDGGGVLIDTFVEETVVYGDEPPVAVEGEMQWILNDNDNNAGNNSVAGLVARTGAYAPITLYTPTTPSWAVRKWKQRREPVLSALRTLAGQIGWECRYKWDANPDQKAWRLTFHEPDRARTDADAIVIPDDLLTVDTLSRSLFGIRNVVRVVYPSSETTLPAIPPLPGGYVARQGWNNIDGESQRMTAYIEIESSAGIAAVGRRLFMEIAEGSSSQIDTIGEAFDMAYAALRDLEEAAIDKSVTLPLMPELELNDYILFTPNAQLFTAPQRLAVRSIVHRYAEQATTQVTLRGKPSIGFKRWLRLEARGDKVPGVISPVDALGDLTQGTLLTVMRNILDRTAYLSGGKFIGVRNGNFQAFTNGQRNVPDAWSMRAGVWLTDANVETVTQQSGNKALRLNTVTAQVVSDLIPVDGDFSTPYSVQLLWQRTVAGTYNVRVDVEFVAADKVTVLGTTTLEPGLNQLPGFQAVPATAGTWFLSRADGVRPPLGGLARYARLVLRGSLTGVFVPLILDDVGFYRTARELCTFTVNPYTLPGATLGWYPVRNTATGYPSVASIGRYDYGNNFFYTGVGASPFGASIVYLTGEAIGNNKGDGFYVREDGVYRVSANVCVNSSSNSTQYSCARLIKNATYNANYTNATGTILYQTNAVELIPVANFNNANVAGQRANLFNLSGRFSLQRGDTLHLEFNRTITAQNALGSGSGDLIRFNVKQEVAQ